MFDSLGDKLNNVFRKLSGQATLTEGNIQEALREIRLALLEADVNLTVVKEFIERVKSDCIGQEVLKNVKPSEQIVKIVHDRLVELLGSEQAELDLSRTPTVIMLVGLHGSGKTTTAAKLANLLKNDKKRVLLAAADVYRPAAIDQLEILGREIGVEVYSQRGQTNVAQIGLDALKEARFRHDDVLIIDTAGRLQIDENMIQELVRLRDTVHANEILLVADAALGQEAVSVAEHFNDALSLSGFILTKLDGDSRAGAALSIREVTKQPVKFIGTGEKLDDLEIFYPERLAGRILGMGDVVSLVEKAAREIDEKEAEKMKAKLKKNQFDFTDFLTQLRQLNKLGGMESLLKFLPGGREISGMLGAMDPRYFARVEAMILSMTPAERDNPDLLDNLSRRKRIARGSAQPVEQVNAMVKQFNQMRKMVKKTGLFSKMFGSAPDAAAPGDMGALPGSLGGGAMPDMGAFNPFSGQGTVRQPSKKEQERKKKLAKMQKKDRQKQRRKKK